MRPNVMIFHTHTHTSVKFDKPRMTCEPNNFSFFIIFYLIFIAFPTYLLSFFFGLKAGFDT